MARYEWLLRANVDFSKTDSPTASRLNSSQSENLSADVGVSVPLQTGGTLDFSVPVSRFKTNNEFSTLNPSYTSDAVARLSQPLLRGAGFDVNAAVMLDACDAAHLLIIDDAANEGTQQAIRAVSDVVRSRLERRRLTVLTTNVVSEAFRTRYGVPLADRLRHAAEAPDLRHEKSMRGAA